MKRNEKLVVHGNEFYVIDLDCWEKKGRNLTENMENEIQKNEKCWGIRKRKSSNQTENR